VGVAFTLDDALLESRIPLNDWGGLGTFDPDVEYFAYAASYHVAGLVFDRTDFEGLRSVWRGLVGGEMSYQPAHGTGVPEARVSSHLARWQLLLDLLDERTGANYDDIWIDWVVNDAQAALMDDRAAARDRYALLVQEAGDWNLPSDLRSAMSTWMFDEAESQIEMAGDVLADRDEIFAQADRLHLEAPGELEATFEGDGGLAAAQEEAAQELEVLAAIAETTDRLEDGRSLFETVGLLGADPDAQLDSARTAFEDGRLDAAADASAQALAARQGAESAGQLRVAVGGGGVVVLGVGAVVAVRIRRRRRPASAVDASVLPAPDAPPGPTEPPEAGA